VFVNRFYYPDLSATSQLLTDLAEHMADRGQTVHVVTSRQRYDAPAERLEPFETVADVVIHRLSTSRFGRTSDVGRAIDYVSFYIAGLIFLVRFLRAGDVLVCKTDPPLVSIIGAMAARLKGAVLVNWLQDLYPEIARASGISIARGPMGAVLTWVRDISLRAAEVNIAIGEDMAALIAERGVNWDKLRVISNWADDEVIGEPVSPGKLRQDWGLSGTFVVGYSGNLGRAHEFETLLGAAQLLRDRDEIRFLFIGGGHHVGALAAAARERGLERSFVFKPYQDRARLGESLRVTDVHWVSLRPEFNGLVVPSKIYGVLAAGRPLIAVSGAGDEIARLTRDEQIGFAVEVGDPAALASAIASLADDAQLTAAMGLRAKQLMRDRFTKRDTLQVWAALLETAGQAAGSG